MYQSYPTQMGGRIHWSMTIRHHPAMKRCSRLNSTEGLRKAEKTPRRTRQSLGVSEDNGGTSYKWIMFGVNLCVCVSKWRIQFNDEPEWDLTSKKMVDFHRDLIWFNGRSNHVTNSIVIRYVWKWCIPSILMGNLKPVSDTPMCWRN